MSDATDDLRLGLSLLARDLTHVLWLPTLTVLNLEAAVVTASPIAAGNAVAAVGAALTFAWAARRGAYAEAIESLRPLVSRPAPTVEAHA